MQEMHFGETIKRVEIARLHERKKEFRAGDVLLLSGHLYTARDAAHRKILEMLREGREIPEFRLKHSVIYYVGPTPAMDGRAIGSAGPTSSYRMDAWTEPLLQEGVTATIGKGERSLQAYEMLRSYGALYLVATGGAGALLSRRILHSRIICFEELGTEAVRKLQVEDFPVVVAQDVYGENLFLNRREKNKNIK